MKSNPYKSFIAFKHNLNVRALVDVDGIAEMGSPFGTGYVTRDPIGGQWRNSGLAQVADETMALALGSGGKVAFLLHVQFNERILPGKVRDEKVKVRIAKITEQQGHKVSKKQYAEVRDDVEAELLPQAFIRRSIVPVIFDRDFMFIFTGSPTRADSVVAIVTPAMQEFKSDFTLTYVHPEGGEHKVLQSLTGMLTDSTFQDHDFNVGTSAVLKGQDGDAKKTIRIKDLNLGSGDVIDLMKRDYLVHEIAIELLGDDGQPMIDFKVNDKLIFKACSMTGMHMEGTQRDDAVQELLAFSWLVAKTYRIMLDEVLAYMGGLPVAELEDEDDL